MPLPGILSGVSATKKKPMFDDFTNTHDFLQLLTGYLVLLSVIVYNLVDILLTRFLLLIAILMKCKALAMLVRLSTCT